MDPSAFGGKSLKIKSNAQAAREKFRHERKPTPTGMDPSAFGGKSLKIKSNAQAAREKFLARKKPTPGGNNDSNVVDTAREIFLKKKLKKKKKKKQIQSTKIQQQQQLLAEKRKLLEQRQQRFAKKIKASPPKSSSRPSLVMQSFTKTSSPSSSSSIKYITCKETAEMIVPKGKSMQWLPSTLRCWGECEGMCPKSEQQSRRRISHENTSERIKIQLNAGDAGVHVFEMKPHGKLITRYTRAAADKDLNADMESLRPPKWLGTICGSTHEVCTHSRL